MSSTVAEVDVAPSPGRMFFTILPSIVLPMFLASVDGTIVATALPAIAGDLGDVERVPWVVVSYLVAATIAAPVYGRLGDVLGRRRMLLASLALSTLAHVVCAMAPSVLLLILARVLLGFGGGGLMTLSQALVGEAVPPRQRGRYQGYLASVFVCSSMFGPVAGGWLTQHWGWRSVFLVCVPISLAALALAWRLPRRMAGPGRLHFDFLGLGLFAGFIAPGLLALELARQMSFAILPAVLALLGVAVASLLLLIRQEKRAAAPLLPIAFLRQTAVWRTDTMAACVGATLVSMITFLPIYLQVARGATPSQSGLLMLPLTALIAVGSMITGRTISRTGRTAIIPSIGMPVLFCLLVALALVGPHLSLNQLPWLFGAIALFCGTAMPVVQVTVQTLAGAKNLGAAAASVQFSRSIGAATGTAIVSAVLFAVLAATDPATATTFGRIVQLGPAALAGLSAGQVAVIQSEIADAFRAAFLTIAVFAAMASLMAWLIPVRRI
jgi:EmrB/QacA subfamily drug resistance transporter